jgi:hypothetical protein
MRTTSRILSLSITVVLGFGAVVASGGGRVRAGMDSNTLLQYLQSPKHQERRRAVDRLGLLRDPASTQPLINLLATERYTHVIGAVLYSLAYIGAPEAYPVIQWHLTHNDAKVVRAAGRAAKIYERYRAYYGQQLPIVHGRPQLPQTPGAPPPLEEPPAEPAPADE